MNKLVLWTIKDEKEQLYQIIDFDGDYRNSNEVVAAINKHLSKGFKPLLWSNSIEIGDTLLVLLYRGDNGHKYNFSCCLNAVKYIDTLKVGDIRKPTQYEHELALYIALHDADGTFDKKVGTKPPQ